MINYNRFHPVISFDWALEHSLRIPANFVVLESFLSTLLGQAIQVVSVEEPSLDYEEGGIPICRLDLLVKDAKDINSASFFVQLRTFYSGTVLAPMLCEIGRFTLVQRKKEPRFTEFKKIIFVAIVYFLPVSEIAKSAEYIVHGKSEFSEFSTQNPIALPKHVLPEYYLINLSNSPQTPQTALDEWSYYFQHMEILDTFQAVGIQQTRKLLSVRQLDETELYSYERFLLDRASYQGRIMSAWESGVYEGRMSVEKRKIAHKMRAKGCELAEIAEMTGLAEAEIVALEVL